MARKLPSAAPQMQTASIAHTFVVDTGSDPTTGTSCAPGHGAGTCSLRAAVAAADADTGNIDAITIPAGMEVKLSQEVALDLTNSMIITGGAGTVVNGEGQEVFDQSGSPVVQMSGFTITNGVTTGDGGGIHCSNGSLALSGMTFAGNIAADGGGIYTNSGCQLWVDGSVFRDNKATGGISSGTPQAAPAYGDGGGMYTYGSANIIRTVVGGSTMADANTAEEGAGIYNYDGDVTITNSVISHNSSPDSYGYGVGLYNDEVMDVVGTSIDHNVAPRGADGVGMDVEYLTTMSNSTFAFNQSAGTSSVYGGALYDDGDTTTLTNVSFGGTTSAPTNGSGVYGGAVLSYAYNFSWVGGSVTNTVNGVNGKSDYIEGGAVYLDGSHASLNNVMITNTSNNSLPDEYPEGGAIYINAYTDLTNVSIADTTNQGYDVYGGAIYNDDYSTLSNISITNTVNHAIDSSGGYIAGGAIYNDGENFAMKNLAVGNTSNTADTGSTTPSSAASEVDGGFLYNDYESTGTNVSVTNTTSVASGGDGESYGGALFNDRSLVLRDTQFLGTVVQADQFVEGGFIYNDDRLQATNFTVGNGTVKVLGGTMAGTPYGEGSIMYNNSQANLINTTMDNITTSVASTGNYNWAIENQDLLQVTNSTFANDSVTGPAISTSYPEATRLFFAYGSSQASLLNSIVASTTPAQNCGTQSTTSLILSSGFNIDSGHSCGFTNTGDLQNTNPMVAALANNGGSVLTAALLAGSPAINAGTNQGCPATDARGVTRPVGASCDIGAFEFVPAAPAVPGYWTVASDGGVFTFGPGAHFYGSTGGITLAKPIVGMARDAATGGYWLVASDGGVFAFHAPFYGSLGGITLAKPIVGIAAAPGGNGYWLVASDGGVFAFGPGAHFYGSLGGVTLAKLVVGMDAEPATGGYWLVASDGGVFAFHAPFFGSMGGLTLNKPMVGLASAA